MRLKLGDRNKHGKQLFPSAGHDRANALRVVAIALKVSTTVEGQLTKRRIMVGSSRHLFLRVALASVPALVASPLQANLIVNGDFESGGSAFYVASKYSRQVGGHVTPGHYGLINNPATSYSNGYASFGDHTTGAGTMLFIDAAESPATPLAVWTQTIAVTSFTDYIFQGFAREADTSSNTAVLRFVVDSTALGADFTLDAVGSGVGWQSFTREFNSGSNTSITISIIDVNRSSNYGNDFVLDDLSLTRGAVPEPSSMAMATAGGLAMLAFAMMGRPRG